MNNELYHYGVIGQKWGVRRYQNIDGSLTEAGKAHRAKYIAKEKARVDRQHDKWERRYQRQADRAARKGDAATQKEYLDKIKDSQRSRKRTKNYIDNMSWQQIQADEAQDRAGIAKVAKTALAVGTAAAVGGGLYSVGRIGFGAASAALRGLNVDALGETAMHYADLGIRTYVNIRSWVLGTTLDQVAINLNTNMAGEIGSKFGTAVGSLASTAGNAAAPGVSKGASAIAAATETALANTGAAAARGITTGSGSMSTGLGAAGPKLGSGTTLGSNALARSLTNSGEDIATAILANSLMNVAVNSPEAMTYAQYLSRYQ